MSALAENPVGEQLEVQLFAGDLNDEAFRAAGMASWLAWDIETTGLDWREERIATVQVATENHVFVVQVKADDVPSRLKQLLQEPTLCKIFHHAMFDLRFMAYYWGATPANVVDTKIASKLAHRGAEASQHSLAALVEEHLGVELDKTQRLSDWTATTLDARQLRYAADDVIYLKPLYDKLSGELAARGLLVLRDRCNAHLPARVALELGDFGDVYAY
jgi:ribonuclease D